MHFCFAVSIIICNFAECNYKYVNIMLFKNLREFPIPNFAYVSKNDGRVFEYIIEEGKPLVKCPRRSIGKATSATTMIPNSNFKEFHKDLWIQFYGEKDYVPSRILVNAGLYASTLSIVSKSGLYDILIDTIGTIPANGTIDYSMYQMMSKSNVAMTYKEHMDRYVQFSPNTYSDTWWSNFFRTKISDNNRELFLSKWLLKCKENGTESVYLSIDGSNMDCNAQKCELAEPGKAKSGNTDSNLIGTITAVDAETGLPIYYSVFNGGKVDSKSIIKVIKTLKNHKITVKGIILDRGLCFNNVLDEIGDEYDYILMLHSDTYGHLEMLEKYLDEIRWNVSYAICDKALFGIEKKQKLFKSNDREAYVSLFFDGMNASERSETLIMKVLKARKELQCKIDSNEQNIQVPENLKQYISLEIVDGTVKVVCDYEKWQRDIDVKGYYSIASTTSIGPSETYRRYHLRDASETGYAILKTQLGEHVIRTHSTDSIETKMFVGFIASIIRSYFMNACLNNGLDTNQMIGEISRLQFMSDERGRYSFIEDSSIRQRSLMNALGITVETMKQLAAEYSNRKNAVSTLIRKFPDGMPEEYQRRKRGGRKKGSLNKKTLKKLAQQQRSDKAQKQEPNSSSTSEQQKRRPGRPKGSLNKATIAKLEEQKAQKKRGRPKGSRGKKFTSVQKSHKIGRPLGSKNKKTLARIAAETLTNDPKKN